MIGWGAERTLVLYIGCDCTIVSWLARALNMTSVHNLYRTNITNQKKGKQGADTHFTMYKIMESIEEVRWAHVNQQHAIVSYFINSNFVNFHPNEASRISSGVYWKHQTHSIYYVVGHHSTLPDLNRAQLALNGPFNSCF